MAGVEEAPDGVPAEEEGIVGDFGEPPSREEIRQSLRRQPKPSSPRTYDLSEAEFWGHRYVPAGSVLVFADPASTTTPPARVAALVQGTESRASGIWVSVKILGSDQEDAKKEAQRFFKSGKKRIHLCYEGGEGECELIGTDGLHLRQFEWYPPGDFIAEWLSAHAKKAINGGKAMALAEEKKANQEDEDPPPREGPGPGILSSVEERLRSLSRPSALRRVRFTGVEDVPGSPSIPGGRATTSRAGPGAGAGGSRSLVPVTKTPLAVKSEVIDVDAEVEKKKGKKKKRSSSLAESLVMAAKRENEPSPEEKKRKRKSRSRSRSRKSKKKKKRHSSSQDSRSRSSSSGTSSEASLLPPLQKKSQKSPGAVFRMLEEHMAERLSQDAALNWEGHLEEERLGSRPSSTATSNSV
jgi:hypothetical protein